MKTAIVIGATGLVGAYLVNKLNDSKLYRVHSISPTNIFG
ncbi:MAG: NAD-dependent epimerase/dehydratase family protein [Bacteroidetes bacterium]|nr:NAD-dependent epimerase/dehydratase family protein [Bacteroidota bacterium]